MQNILGIDWGSKHIGIAIANTKDKIAGIFGTLPRKPWSSTSKALHEICDSRSVSLMVLGWPEYHQSKRHGTICSAMGLLRAEKFPPIVLQNEAYTSQAVSELPKIHNHSCAAALILQDYLEGNACA